MKGVFIMMKNITKKLMVTFLVLVCLFTLIPSVNANAATKITESVYVNNKLTLKKGKTYTLKMNYKSCATPFYAIA